DFDRTAEPAAGLIDETVLKVVDAHRAERGFGEVEELLTRRRTFPGDEIHLIVAVEMHLVGPVAELFTGLELVDDVRIAGRGNERWEPVEAGYQAVLDFARRNLSGPAGDARRAEAAFEYRSLAAGKRRLAAVGPGEVLGAVVGRKDENRIVLEAVVFQFFHDAADDVVELRHAGLINVPTVLGRAHVLVFFGKVGDDVHARGIEPNEKGLVVGLGFVDELERMVEDLVVDRLHAIG